MGILTSNYPAFPDYVLSYNVIDLALSKSNNSDVYILECYNSDTEYPHYYIYRPTLDNNNNANHSWLAVNQSDINTLIPAERQYIYSTYDIYNNDILVSKGMPKSEILANSQSYATVGNYSSSTFLTALNDTKLVLSIAFVLLIACIGFRKGFNWLRCTIKGA